MFFTSQNKSQGFSLVEVMVTIVIGAVLMGIVSSNFPQLKRTADRFLGQAFFEEQYLIFLLKLEDEYHQAASCDPQGAGERAGKLIFEQDENLDGDLDDSGERITYRWNSKEKRIDRKSGSGYFQALLEGVTAFSWKQVQDSPVCHEMQIRSVFSSQLRRILYCMDIP